MELISPENCKLAIEKNEALIIDVRENYEFTNCNIGFLHIPMGEINERIDEIPSDKKIIIMCQSGRRAEAVANLLETEYNLKPIYIMEGGINAWKEKIDQTLQLD
ncbi:MAG: rhodanese-like domain-containing protein [Flavobacteriales bacterium]|nr:rhodanese-like domain-containing protein [Flavobacteriales bacterium]